MKLLAVVIFCVFVTCLHAKSESWGPGNLIDIISNKTGRFTEYVKNKTEDVKTNIYYNYKKVKESNDEIIDYVGEKKDKIRQKFELFLNEASETGKKLMKKVIPDKLTNKCDTKDPQITMTTPQLIALHGYPAEAYTIATDDGYLLTLHRIPYSKYTPNKTSKKTVLLHHGLLGSSADWVLAGPEKSLAYVLSDAGYDVWMANVRGNTYSKAHVKWNVESSEFWNFTWHDVSQHDLPAVIDFIRSVKGPDVKLNYIGHSMGTTVLFALLSTKTEYNKKLRAGFALAPVAYMSHIRSPLRLLAPLAHDIAYLLKILGAKEFLPQNSVLHWLSEHVCELNHWEEIVCENSMFVLCGYDERQFNATLLPIILSHVPAGASTKSLVHYAQEIHNGGSFQQYDYGAEGNMAQYGSKTPPQYDLEAITLPVALFSAENDWLAGEEDVAKLNKKLSNPIEHYVVPFKEFNHIDFLWAVDAPKLYYQKLLELLNEEYHS